MNIQQQALQLQHPLFSTKDLVESCSIIAHIGSILINKCDVQSGTKYSVYFYFLNWLGQLMLQLYNSETHRYVAVTIRQEIWGEGHVMTTVMQYKEYSINEHVTYV